MTPLITNFPLEPSTSSLRYAQMPIEANLESLLLVLHPPSVVLEEEGCHEEFMFS